MEKTLYDEKYDLIQNSPQKKRKVENFDIGIWKIKLDYVEGGSKFEVVNYFGNPNNEVFTIKFDQNCNYIAAGLGDGITKEKQFKISQAHPTILLQLVWKPQLNVSKPKPILITGNTDGNLYYWNAVTGDLINKINEKDNSILALDFNNSGSKFASGGKDFKIRIYDEEKHEIVQTYNSAEWDYVGHKNRIFCLKFLKSHDFEKVEKNEKGEKQKEENNEKTENNENKNNENPIFSTIFNSNHENILLSGGWDSNLHFWDLRSPKCIGTILGPSISGDSIDFYNGSILTGSHRDKEQLQIWDFSTRKLIQNVDWEFGYPIENAYIYSCQFTKKENGMDIIAGSSGRNELKLFNSTKNYKTIGKIFGYSKGCYTVDYSENKNLFGFAGGDGIVFIVKIK